MTMTSPFSSQENQDPMLPPSIRASSPLDDNPASSQTKHVKPRRPPPVTPRRFNRFFNPESRCSGRDTFERPSLRDITGNARAQARHSESTYLRAEDAVQRRSVLFEAIDHERAHKRRKARHTSSIDFEAELDAERDSGYFGSSQELGHHSELDDSSDDERSCRAVHPPSSPILGSSPCNRKLSKSSPRKPGYAPAETVHVYPKRIQRSSAMRLLNQPPQYTELNWRNHLPSFTTGRENRYTDFRNGLPYCLASCHTDSLVATGDESGEVTLLDTQAGRFSETFLKFAPHRNAIFSLSFSADDKYLATASGDQRAGVLDMKTREFVAMLEGHTASVKDIAFMPQSEKVLATASRDGFIGIWDIRYRQPYKTRSTDRCDHPNARHLTYCHPGLFSTQMYKRIHPVHAQSTGSSSTLSSPTSLLFLPHSPHNLITSSSSNAALQLWDLRMHFPARNAPKSLKDEQAPLSCTSTAGMRAFGTTSLALSADGARVYAVSKDSSVYGYATSHLRFGQADPRVSIPVSGEDSISRNTRAASRTDSVGAGPLLRLTHPALRVHSFYIRCALRPSSAENGASDVLAVGTSGGVDTGAAAGGPVLFPLDEKLLGRASREPRGSVGSQTVKMGGCAFPSFEVGRVLRDGHNPRCEVTDVAWSRSGELVSVADDSCTRLWAECEDSDDDENQDGDGE